MAVRNYSQSQLNNNMSGTSANAIYYATHGGSGNTPVIYNNGSGNYASADRNGNITYTIGGGAGAGLSDGSGGSGGRSGSGSGSGGDGGSGGGYGYEAYGYGGGGGYDYASMIAQMLAEQRAAAQAAYDASKARLDEAYDNTYAALKNNLNSSLDTMKKNYEFGQKTQNDDASKSLREAYINYMMNRRNLDQNLAAAGISGGATESSMAKLFNNYGSSRNNINTTLAKNLAQLLNTYENNVASANQAYSLQDAEARRNYASQLNSLEQMLAGNLMSNYSGSSLSSLANFAKTLSDITGDMGAAMNVFTPTQNTLGVNLVNSSQGNNMGSITDYAKYLEMIERMGQGA